MYIFGGDTNLDYEQIKERRAKADQLAQSLMARRSQNAGEGLSKVALALMMRAQNKKLDKREGELRDASKASTNAFVSALTGRPSGGSSGGGGSVSIPSGDVAAQVRSGLIERGLPEHVADAFLINFQDESGLDPGINEIAPIVPGSRGGFGLYQLTGPRRRDYEAFAAERGVDPSDIPAQLDWLMYELEGPEARAAQSILGAKDTGTAAAAIVNNFLRPAEQHRAAREARYLGGQYSLPEIQHQVMPGAQQYVPPPGQPLDGVMAAGAPAPAPGQVQQANYSVPAQQPQQAPQPQGNRFANISPQMALQVLQDPMAPAHIKSLAQQALDYHMQDPREREMQALELEARRAELERQVNGGGGYRVLSDAEEQELGLPQQGTYQIGPDNKIATISTPSTGREAISLGNGAFAVPDDTQPSGYRVEFAAGSEAEAKRRAASTSASAEAQRATETMRVIDLVLNNPKLPAVTGRFDGAIDPEGIFAPLYFGQDAQDLLPIIKQIQGQAFLQAFESLKGGGQITETEGKAATEAQARLSRRQSPEAFKAALIELRMIADAAARRARGEQVPEITREAVEAEIERLIGGRSGSRRPQREAPAGELTDDDLRWLDGNG